ncbi:MAG TPA: hypothetical protein VKT80_12010 [Chloroflexota bacterium]|nr:hypothetical protein [Chloroflexota bacterium]
MNPGTGSRRQEGGGLDVAHRHQGFGCLPLGQRLGGKPGLPRELGFLTQGTDTMEQRRLASTPALDQCGEVLKIPRLHVHDKASLWNRQIEAIGQR